MIDVKYQNLMNFFENIKLNYNEPNNPIPYINSVKNALNYINTIKETNYKNISSKVPLFLSQKYKELYRPLTPRQTNCCTKCILLATKNCYTDAMCELLDAFDDYGKYKEKNLISINECFLFSNILELLYEQLIKKDEI